MKKLTLAAIVLASLAVSTAGQAKSRVQANHSGSMAAGAPVVSTATSARVFSRSENINYGGRVPENRIAAESDFINSGATSSPAPIAERDNATIETSVEISKPRSTDNSTNSPKPIVVPSSLTEVYRVGVGDVLDIQLANNSTNKSTLFTVLEGGTLDYPLVGLPVPVAGLTAAEIAERLSERIIVLENPDVVVNVRDYASHSVSVSGLVAAPGTKFLQREAVPLYVVTSQARPLPEAGRATVVRSGNPAIEVNLQEAGSLSMLVVPGDAIKFSVDPAGSSRFFFTGGAIKAPGQKPYHAGLTLTQAILASGGVKREGEAKVLLSRRGSDGHLFTIEYNLRQIEKGEIPDPFLQEGDRLRVGKQ